MKTKVKLLAGSVALMASLGAQAQVIDLFSEPDLQAVQDFDNTVGTDVADQYAELTPGATIIGGFRDLVIDATEGAVPPVDPVPGLGAKLTVVGSTNTLSWSNDDGVRSTAAVQWDGDDSGDVATLQTDRGVDLFDLVDQTGCPTTGCDQFNFTILRSDLGFDFEIGVWTTDDQFTSIASTGQQIAEPGLEIELPFSVFEQCEDFTDSTGTFNFSTTCGAGDNVANPGDTVAVMTSVSALQLLLSNSDSALPVSVDLAISSITKDGTSVPEPGSLALLGAGLLVGGFARRRRNSKA